MINHDRLLKKLHSKKPKNIFEKPDLPAAVGITFE